MAQILTDEILEQYAEYLQSEEKAPLTIEKYLRDVRKLQDYADGAELDKAVVLEFKSKIYMKDHYRISTVNSILESVNRLFEYLGWYSLRVKTYRVQREAFVPEDRYLSMEEYKTLLGEARKQNKKRLYLILETLASMGLRVSELYCVTVPAVRSGIVEVNNKGKIRRVLLPRKMQQQLLSYAKKMGITEGHIFRTRSGRPVDRSNIWKEMKRLCKETGVECTKVFPHNLRKLFAISLYRVQKDIVRLADILGHSSIEVTRGYLRETTREHRKSLERLGLVGAAW